MILFLYLLRAVMGRLVLALPGLALIVLSFDLGDQGRRLALTLGWSTVLKASLFHLPLMMVQVFPAALLLSAVLAITSLRRQGELEAMQAAGASSVRLCSPLLSAGLLSALLALALGELVVPPCEGRADTLYRHQRVSSLTGLQQAPSWIRVDNWFIHRAPKGAQQVLALKLDKTFQVRQRIEGRWSPGQKGLREVEALRPGSDLPAPLLDRAEEHWGRSRVRAEALDLVSLNRRLRLQQQAGQRDPTEVLVWHTKLSYPLVNLLTALLACSFISRRGRRSPVRELLLAGAYLLGLWFLIAGGWVLGRSGWLSPAAGAWAPLIPGFLGVAALLWRGFR